MRIILIATTALLVLGGCANRQAVPGPDYMILDEVVYVNEFPRIIHMSDPERIDIDIIGGFDFAILDSLVVFSSSRKDEMWSFYSLPDFESLGSCIRIGNGPTELLQTPWIYQSSFYSKGGQLFASLYDFDRGRLLELNVSKTLDGGIEDISVINRSLPPSLFDFVYIDSVTFFCREISGDLTQQNRYLLENDQKVVPDAFEKLNRASIKPNGEFNILSTNIRYHNDSGRFIEAPIMLNYINIYSTDGSFSRTVCVDENLDNITDLQQMERSKLRLSYGSVCVYDNMFGVFQRGRSDQSGQTRLPSIQFFNIDGDPLLEFQFDHELSNFDIDFKNGFLYTYYIDTEDFFRYDIKDILNDT